MNEPDETTDIPAAPILEHEPAPADPPPPPVAPAPRVVRRGGTPFWLTLLLVLGLGGAIYYVWSQPRPGETGLVGLPEQVDAQNQAVTRIDRRTLALEQTVQAIGARIDKLGAPKPAPDQPADNGDVGKRLDELSARVDALSPRVQAAADAQAQLQSQLQSVQAKAEAPSAAPPSPPPPADPAPAIAAIGGRVDQGLAEQKAALDTLEGRVGKLEQGAGQVAGLADRAARVARLQAAATALAAGEKLGDLPDAPPALARYANQAPPTELALREEFPQVAEAALAASRPTDESPNVFQRALARLERTVTVRRGDHVLVGDPAAGILARAQADVQSGNLAGAVGVLGGLQGPAAEAVRDWVERTKSVLDARAALAGLAAHS